MKRITALAAVACLCGLGLAAPPAQAGYLVELMQQGNNVVASGSGTLDLTALTKDPNNKEANGTAIDPSLPSFQSGQFTQFVGDDIYTTISGPANFGSGGLHGGTGTGDSVGVGFDSTPALFVPSGYQSGASLSNTGTFSNASFASLGVTPGTYLWTWGTGAHADSFTLKIDAPVPEPASLTLLAIGMVGFFGYRWRRRRLAA